MKSPSLTKVSVSICALVGGVFLSSASAKPFKLFSHDHDRDREKEKEQEAETKFYMVTDGPAQPGSTGIVRIVPVPPNGAAPAPNVRVVPVPEPKSRKSRSGETRYLEPVEVPAETVTTETRVIRKAEAVEETPARVTVTEEKREPVKTSRSSSKKETASTSKKKVQQPERDDEVEAIPRVSIREKEVDREVAPAATKRQVVEETSTPRREAVEESTSTSVVRSNNPLMPNPTATEERKALVPADVPAPRRETTVTKEVTTSRAPAVQEAPPEQRVQQVEDSVTSSLPVNPPHLTAPSDYPNLTAPHDGPSSHEPIAPANLSPGAIEKTSDAKRSSSDVPIAEKTEKPGFVMTPFTPKKLIDVRGMASGSLAKDPSTNQVFRVP